jgi:hypothetical protein
LISVLKILQPQGYYTVIFIFMLKIVDNLLRNKTVGFESIIPMIILD